MKSNKYWFKPKTYGYGAQPTSWEGWLSVLIFAVLFLLFLGISANTKYRFLIVFNVILVIGLVILSKNKTKGKWAWRWGE